MFMHVGMLHLMQGMLLLAEHWDSARHFGCDMSGELLWSAKSERH